MHGMATYALAVVVSTQPPPPLSQSHPLSRAIRTMVYNNMMFGVMHRTCQPGPARTAARWTKDPLSTRRRHQWHGAAAAAAERVAEKGVGVR